MNKLLNICQQEGSTKGENYMNKEKKSICESSYTAVYKTTQLLSN